MSELYHHGVKGMKWGVRRYQNPDGTLTEKGKRKLASYKERELKKLNSKYNIEKLDRKRSKLEEKYGSSDDPKKQQKITAAKYKQLKAEGMKYLESNAVRNMTYSDMKAERVAVGKAFIKKAMFVGLGNWTVNSVTGDVGFMTSFNNEQLKTDRRVSAGAKLLLDVNSRKKTGWNGRWYY